MTYSKEQILDRIRSAVKKQDPEAEVILFGSQAREANNKYSDWDILILVNAQHIDRDTEKAYRDAIFDVQLETGEAISTFVFSKEEWHQKHAMTPLYDNVQKDGVLLWMTDSRQDYIKYRIKKSDEAYNDAALLAQNERWNACMNRLYYSSFYLISALLYQKAIKAQTHKGVKTQFFLHFVKPGIVDKASGKLYSHLFDWRQETDYGDFMEFDKDVVEPLLLQVQRFNEAIKQLINENSD